MMPSFEVVFSPALLPHHTISGKTIIIIDILRATSTICVALDRGIKKIIPVENIEDAVVLMKTGVLAAAERDGIKVDGFQLGNSPYDFLHNDISGETLVMTTTNGTRALNMSLDAKKIYIGSFLNLGALTTRLIEENENVLAVCAGWKNKFNLEDSLFAGALFSVLKPDFQPGDDATIAALNIWESNKNQLREIIGRASHAQRFERLGINHDIDFCIQQSIYSFVPEFSDGSIHI